MVETLFNGGMVNLQRLLLADNCIAMAGVRTRSSACRACRSSSERSAARFCCSQGEAIAVALGRGALSRLRKLSLKGNALLEDSINRLTSCLHERTVRVYITAYS
jgi:hypothetical protein